jgi:hypothetical protein
MSVKKSLIVSEEAAPDELELELEEPPFSALLSALLTVETLLVVDIEILRADWISSGRV